MAYGQRRLTIEWPTLAAMAGVYSAWIIVLWQAPALGAVATALLLAPIITFHSSLQHEVIHGHPTRCDTFNRLLAFPALGLFYPLSRFAALHLAHHRTANLTEPGEDPESFYLAPEAVAALPMPGRLLMQVNTCVLGRLMVGPAIALFQFLRAEWRRTADDQADVAPVWIVHAVNVAATLALARAVGGVGPLTYLAAAYAGYSLLMIRTYAEHRAHLTGGGRSIIVASRGPLAILFLNNNYHAVHHAFPKLAWYRLPGVYRANRARFDARTRGYVFSSYAEVLVPFLLRGKEPLAHPLMRRVTPTPTEGMPVA